MKKIDWNRGWQFLPDDYSFFSIMMPINQVVDLPHDFTIGTIPVAAAPGGKLVGFFRGGIGTYIKTFDVPSAWSDYRIQLGFDGAYMNTEVSVNGHFVTLHHYGYTPFFADLTPYLRWGEKNRVVVIVNNSAPDNTRWYSGSGLYRNVDLVLSPKVHLAPWPIYAFTEKITENGADVIVEATVENHTQESVTKTMTITLMDMEGTKEIAHSLLKLTISSRSFATTRTQWHIAEPALWSIDHPNLYRILVVQGIPEEDRDEVVFGIRTVAIDAKKGLLINGQPVKLKGGCVHHDNGLLGAASFFDSEYRRMKLHRDNGFNAIRCAHNPPSRDMLDACDCLGLLVMDEAFDVWRLRKNANDYHLYFDQDWRDDMASFMKRDRNHPCIVMWSIGNEIVERNGLSHGDETCAMLAAYARSLDATRPITSAIPTPFNGLDDEHMMGVLRSWQERLMKGETFQNLSTPYTHSIFNGLTDAYAASLDVVSYNYLDERYEEDTKKYPDRILLGAESYPSKFDIVWERVLANPHVIGDFTWTSMDYLGEAGLGIAQYRDPSETLPATPGLGGPIVPFPWRTANCGDFDLCGYDRPQLHFRKIVWGSPETYIAVHDPAHHGHVEILGRWGWSQTLNAWAYPGQVGKPVTVEVFSGADSVELILNGSSIGVAPAGKSYRYRAGFETTYQPGTLVAISRTDGIEISRQTLRSPGLPVRLVFTTVSDTLIADGRSLAFFDVEVVDEYGVTVPLNDVMAIATVTGNATLAAFGNGRPATTESYRSGSFTSFEGRWQAIVRSGYELGIVELTITTERYVTISRTLSVLPPGTRE